MNITKEQISDLLATLSVKIEKADYEQNVGKVLKDYQRKAVIPGFRPGKVPAGLVKKLYYKSVVADEVNKLLSHELSQYIIEEKLNTLGDPLPSEDKPNTIDWDKDEDFEFVFDLALAPTVKIPLDKSIKLTEFNIVADDEAVNQQVKSYTMRFGENIKATEAGNDDLIKGDFVQLDSNGNEKEGGVVAEEALISIEFIKDEDIKQKVKAAKPDETIVFNPVKAYENTTEVSTMLRISNDRTEDMESDFRFTVKEILHFQPAELNEELFKKIFGEETDIKTEEQFREKLKYQMEKTFKPSGDYQFTVDLRKALTESVNVELPEDFLMRWLKVTNEEADATQLEEGFPDFLNGLRWEIIKDNIIKDNDIKVEEEDIKAAARKEMELQFMRYGMFDTNDDLLDNYANNLLGDEKQRKHIIRRAIDEKIMDVVKSLITIEEKNLTSAEFSNLMEAKEA